MPQPPWMALGVIPAAAGPATIGVVAARRQRLTTARLVVRALDPGRELPAGGVDVAPAGEPHGRVEPELGDHAAGKPGLDLAQLPLAEAVHRVPEPTVIHRGPVQPHPPRGCDQDMR